MARHSVIASVAFLFVGLAASPAYADGLAARRADASSVIMIGVLFAAVLVASGRRRV